MLLDFAISKDSEYYLEINPHFKCNWELTSTIRLLQHLNLG